MQLEDYSIIAWIMKNGIKNEKGEPIEFRNHSFLYDIYRDFSPHLVVYKAAQIGLSVLQILKAIYVVKKKGFDGIYCVDDKTELLTYAGWKKYNEVKVGEKILTINLNKKVEWTTVKEVFIKNVKMDLSYVKQRNFTMLATDNHRWIVQPEKSDKYQFVETKNLKDKCYLIPKLLEDSSLIDKKEKYSDDYVMLVSWILTEGYYHKRYSKRSKNDGKNLTSITITQSEKVNNNYVIEIRDLINRLNIKCKESKTKNGCINFRITGDECVKIKKKFKNKILTVKFIHELSIKQIRLMIDTMIKADGWVDKDGIKCFIQKNKKFVDNFMMAAFLAGYSPTLFKRKTDDCYSIRLSKYKFVYTNELKIKKRKYKGYIWCPRTDNGTFLARRENCIYWTGNTMPTDGDVSVFVGGKVNRIIANNEVLKSYTKDKDNVEQKAIGDGMLYFRGSFSKRAAISVTSDLNIHDEEDFSDQIVIGDYESRLQHSKYKWDWHFGHPSTLGVGVSKYWERSDQKHWFITCEHCKERQYLVWPESICPERKIYQCKNCKKEISDDVRRRGEWVKKYREAKYSGYWIPLLIAPWINAQYIIDKSEEKTEEYFTNRVLGLPYVGSGNKLVEQDIMQCVLPEENIQKGRIVIGVDTGVKLYYVIGNEQGIFYYGVAQGYDEIEAMMRKWPNSVVVFDQGGDLIGVRQLREKYIGRVFLCHYRVNRRTMELITWGENEEMGNVIVDRNRVMQIVVEEFKTKRMTLNGKREDYHNYWLHWNNIYRVGQENSLGVIEYKWLRSGADHWCHATLYWRVGLSKFASGEGALIGNKSEFNFKTSPEIDLDGKGILINNWFK